MSNEDTGSRVNHGLFLRVGLIPAANRTTPFGFNAPRLGKPNSLPERDSAD